MVVILALFGLVAMLLWNALLPSIFGLPVLGYWQTVGILLLARILFGGRGRMAQTGGRRGGPFNRQANKLREKWMNMSEDERREFMEKENGYSGFRNALHDHFARVHRFFDEDVKEEKNGKEEKKEEKKNE